MKNLIILFLILPAVSMAQDYELITKVKNDEFTKSKIITTEVVNLSKKENKTPFSLEEKDYTFFSMINYQKKDSPDLVYISFSKIIDLGCLSKNDGKMMVLFEDGELLEITQVSETNCSGTPSAQYILSSRKVAESNDIKAIQSEIENNLELFRSKKVSKLRIYGTKYYDEIILKPGTELIFAQMIEDINKLK